MNGGDRIHCHISLEAEELEGTASPCGPQITYPLPTSTLRWLEFGQHVRGREIVLTCWCALYRGVRVRVGWRVTRLQSSRRAILALSSNAVRLFVEMSNAITHRELGQT